MAPYDSRPGTYAHARVGELLDRQRRHQVLAQGCRGKSEKTQVGLVVVNPSLRKLMR